MKTSKFLASVLALSVALTSFSTFFVGAEAYEDQPEAQIIVQNDSSTSGVSISDKTYDIYKIFDAVVMEGDDDGDDSMEYYVNEDFEDFFEDILEKDKVDYTDDTAFNHAAQEYITAMKNDSDAMTAFVTALRAYIIDNSKEEVDTTDDYHKTGSIETVRSENLAAGYYLILDTDDQTTGSFASAGMLVSLPSRDTDGTLTANTTINIKGSAPTINKEIWHNDITNTDGDTSLLNGTSGSWDVVGDYQIGDTVEFLVTATMPYDMTGYDAYTYILTDTMTEGIAFNSGSIAIYTDSSLSPEYEASGKLHVESDISDSGFKMTFEMLDIKAAFPTLETFYIYYTATVTDDAFTVDYDTNTASLVYSNNPYDSTSTGTDDSAVYAYTFELDVLKTSGDGVSPLEGAVFALYESKTSASTDTTTETQIYLAQDTTSDLDVPTYYPSTGTASDTTGIITTDETGKFNIVGLDDSTTYILKEISAPDGYNEASPVTFTIKATYSDASGVPTPTITATGISNDLSITVVNTSASLLPSTGGIGTTIFTVTGGAIMLAAVVLLIVKTKKEKNQH